MAIFLLTTEPTTSRKNLLMKKATIFLCSLFIIFSKSFSQGDSLPTMHVLIPLQVVSLEAKVINKNVQLLWTVNSNEEARSFEVERSDDGSDYKKIGGRLPVNDSGVVLYEFVDAMPRENKTYSYRVRILAKDGTTSYSELNAVKVNDDIIRCKLKQNPVRNSIDAEVISANTGNLQVSVFTNFGQRVLSETAKLSTGVNNLSFSSQNLLPGIHRLVLETGTERKVITFVKE